MKKALLIGLFLIFGYSTIKGQKYDGIKFYENGKKKSEGNYKGLDHRGYPKEHGLWIYWSPGGKYSSELIYKDGEELDGKKTLWYENGQKWKEEHYKDGKTDGAWIVWNEDGQKWKEENYKNGKLHGKQTYWDGKGNKEIEKTYRDGKKDGLWTSWYSNGQKYSEQTWKNGKYEGTWTWWFENGQKWKEENYKDGIEIDYKEWFKDGKLRE